MARREGDAQLNLRLGRPLLKKLQDAAKAKKRSLNSELLIRLAFTFRPDIERRIEVEGFASVLDDMAEAWSRMAAESINKDDRDYALEMAESAKNLAASQRGQSKGEQSGELAARQRDHESELPTGRFLRPRQRKIGGQS